MQVPDQGAYFNIFNSEAESSSYWFSKNRMDHLFSKREGLS
jgi:hypothetical protein